MVLYLKGVKYKNEIFLSLDNVKEMIELIKSQLNYIEELTFGAIEIRNSKLYRDSELGLN
jgi:hypothetical protein